MITDSELERLLEASSPYARDPGDDTGARRLTDLHLRRDGGVAVHAGPARRAPRTRAWAASAIAIAAVAVVVIGVPVIAGVGRTAPSVSAGVPTPADGAVASGTLESLDGATTGRFAVHADGDSIRVEIVDLQTPHEVLAASGSLSPWNGGLCLDRGKDVDFGAFSTAHGRYTWLVEGHSIPAVWTALDEIDLGVTTPGPKPGECVTTLVARATLDWTVTGDPGPRP